MWSACHVKFVFNKTCPGLSSRFRVRITMPSVRQEPYDVASSCSRKKNDVYTSNFLSQVRSVMEHLPGLDALVKLLQIGSPKFAEHDVYDEEKRSRAYKFGLQARLHPDKNSAPAAGEVFQNVEGFYQECCRRVTEVPIRAKFIAKHEDALQAQPRHQKEINFDFWDDYATKLRWHHDLSHKLGVDRVIQHCAFARRYLAHGRTPETQATRRPAPDGPWFGAYESGDRRLPSNAYAIKSEMLKNGPVVSLSFCPSERYYEANNWSPPGASMDRPHPVLVYGWETTVAGEAWSLYSPTMGLIQCAPGQYGLTDIVICPDSDFSDFRGCTGPCLDVDFSIYSAKELDTTLEIACPDASELLKTLAKTDVLSLRGVKLNVCNKRRLCENFKFAIKAYTYDPIRGGMVLSVERC